MVIMITEPVTKTTWTMMVNDAGDDDDEMMKTMMTIRMLPRQ